MNIEESEMKRCRKKVIIVKNDFDYDKLAKTISAASKVEKECVENEPQEQEKLTFCGFFKLIYYVVFNKKQSNGTMTSGLLSGLIALAFNGLALLGLIVFVCGIVAIANIVKSCAWTSELIANNVATISLMVAFVVIVGMFSLIFRAAANEMAKEKDRNYVVAVFSGIVSFAALIVALVALLKGVG